MANVSISEETRRLLRQIKQDTGAPFIFSANLAIRRLSKYYMFEEEELSQDAEWERYTPRKTVIPSVLWARVHDLAEQWGFDAGEFERAMRAAKIDPDNPRCSPAQARDALRRYRLAHPHHQDGRR